MASSSSVRSQRAGSNHTTTLPVRGKAYTWRTPATRATAFSTTTACAGVATSMGVAKRTRPAASDTTLIHSGAATVRETRSDTPASATGLPTMIVPAGSRHRRRSLLADSFPGLADNVSSGQPGLLCAGLGDPEAAQAHCRDRHRRVMQDFALQRLFESVVGHRASQPRRHQLRRPADDRAEHHPDLLTRHGPPHLADLARAARPTSFVSGGFARLRGHIR